MQYCLYLRKSRADAEAEERGEAETLARHEKTLLELAKKLRLNVTEIYREVVSGETIAARPVMQRLLTEVEQGIWDGVLVMEVERLARGDTVDQGIMAQTFKFSNTKIITPMKTYDPNNEFDEEYFEFGLFMSRREYKTINRRLQRGRIASVKEGKYVGNKSPYGYRRVKLQNDKGFTLEIIPAEADVIKQIYTYYTTGETLSDGTYNRLGVSLICRRLNDMKVPTRTGSDWMPGTVRDILRNPVYAGKVRWNSRKGVKKMVDGQVVIERPRASNEECMIAQGLHPAIIDEDSFNKAQDLLKNNPPRPIGENKTVKNPLSGLIVCGKCGRKMVRRPYSRDYEDTLICASTACNNVSCALHYVEERILQALTEWLSAYKLEWSESGETTGRPDSTIKLLETSKKRAEDDLSTLYKQMDNLHDLLEQGVYTTDTFLDRTKLLTERIQSASNDLDKITTALNAEAMRERNKKNIIPKVEYIIDAYHTLPSAKAKNDLLKEVIEKAIYTKEHGARWHGSPDDFELILYHKLPRE